MRLFLRSSRFHRVENFDVARKRRALAFPLETPNSSDDPSLKLRLRGARWKIPRTKRGRVILDNYPPLFPCICSFAADLAKKKIIHLPFLLNFHDCSRCRPVRCKCPNDGCESTTSRVREEKEGLSFSRNSVRESGKSASFSLGRCNFIKASQRSEVEAIASPASSDDNDTVGESRLGTN